MKKELTLGKSPAYGRREEDARVKIEALLSSAGWMPEQIERGGARFEEQQKALKRKAPDFLLYSKNRRVPLAVVEAKKPGGNMSAAIKQGLDYASLLQCAVVFASDGNIVVSAHITDGKLLVMNDSEVSEFLPEKHIVHFPKFQNMGSWRRIYFQRRFS